MSRTNNSTWFKSQEGHTNLFHIIDYNYDLQWQLLQYNTKNLHTVQFQKEILTTKTQDYITASAFYGDMYWKALISYSN